MIEVEKQAYKRGYNNGFILGMASKGVIKTTEEIGDIKKITARVVNTIGPFVYEVEEEL